MLVVITRTSINSDGAGHAEFFVIDDSGPRLKKISYDPVHGEIYENDIYGFYLYELVEDYNRVVLHSDINIHEFKERIKAYISQAPKFSLTNNNCAKLSYHALKCADIDLGLEENIKCKHLFTGFFAPVKIMTPSEYLQAAKKYKRDRITSEDHEKYVKAYQALENYLEKCPTLEIKKFCTDLLQHIEKEKLLTPERISTFTFLLVETKSLLTLHEPSQRELMFYRQLLIKVMGHEPKSLIALMNCLSISGLFGIFSSPFLVCSPLISNPYFWLTLPVGCGAFAASYSLEKCIYENDGQPYYQVNRSLEESMHIALLNAHRTHDQSRHKKDDDEPSITPLLMQRH